MFRPPLPSFSREESDIFSKGYKRETKHRIFVNRSLQLDKIRFFGFDMDYTLAVYKSPAYETLAFEITRDRLIEIGYPQELKAFAYDPTFPVRGMWFDKWYGTLLKMDQFGNILTCVQGFRMLQREELRKFYPNKFLKMDEGRIYIMNTLFNLPEIYMLACVVHMFTTNKDYTQVEKGVKKGSLYMSYTSIYQDVREATDWMHEGILKQRTLENLETYVEREERLPRLLDRLRSSGAKIFLLTNSDFHYTNKIMTFIMTMPDETMETCNGNFRPWNTYFDYIVTGAKKPLYFNEGTILRQVDLTTGQLCIGHHVGPLESGQIYSGGSCDVFSRMIGARGKDVLYIGDHIFGDILKSKKIVGWRTFLVVPELANEIYVWKKKKTLFDTLQTLNNNLAEVYRDLDIASDIKPDVGRIQADIRTIAEEMEGSYGILGSLFRNGSRQTFFSSQVMRYADLYSFSCINLMYYPLCYLFRAPPMLMPHESTVSHDESPKDSFNELDEAPLGIHKRSRAGSEMCDGVRRLLSIVESEGIAFEQTPSD